jgi:hypothetical protein
MTTWKTFEEDAKGVAEILARHLENASAGKGPVISQPSIAEIVKDLDLAASRSGEASRAAPCGVFRPLPGYDDPAPATRLHGSPVALPHPAGGLAA